MIRKWSIFVLLTFFTIGLVACSGSNNKPTTKDNSAVEAPESNDNTYNQPESESDNSGDEQVRENENFDGQSNNTNHPNETNEKDPNILDLIDDPSIVELVNKEYSLADNY